MSEILSNELDGGSPRPKFFTTFTLECGVIAGIAAAITGIAAIATAAVGWYRADFGPLDYSSTMRLVIPGVTLVTLGATAVFDSFLCGMLGLDRR